MKIKEIEKYKIRDYYMIPVEVVDNMFYLFEQQYRKQKEVIDRAIECLDLWQIPECDKGTMREIQFDSNKQNVLDILKEGIE